MQGGKKVVINTIIVYLQRIFSAGLALFTTPLILKYLGAEDYGLFNITLGFVSLVSFVNWTLSSSTQRYLSYNIGKGDVFQTQKVFYSSVRIHLLYGFFLLLLMAGLYIIGIEKFINIAPDKYGIANTLVIFVGLISVLNIISVPVLGLLRAKENFKYLSVTSIAESVLKLFIAYSLVAFAQEARLRVYGIALLLLTLFIFMAQTLYVKRHYDEFSLKQNLYDKSIVKEMTGFMGWNFIGSLAVLGRNQGNVLLVNLFFGVIKNAAYGVTNQISAAIGILSQSILTSLTPQMMKSAGEDNNENVLYYMSNIARFSVLSVAILGIPLYIEVYSVLDLWLEKVPPSTPELTRAMILYSMATLLSAGFQSAFLSVGKVKEYNLIISVIILLNFPLAYVFFSLGYPVETILHIGAGIEITCFFVRMFLLRKYLPFSPATYLKDVLVTIIAPIAGSVVFIFLLKILLPGLDIFPYYLVYYFLYVGAYFVMVYMFSLDRQQKEALSSKLYKLFKIKA